MLESDGLLEIFDIDKFSFDNLGELSESIFLELVNESLVQVAAEGILEVILRWLDVALDST